MQLACNGRSRSVVAQGHVECMTLISTGMPLPTNVTATMNLLISIEWYYFFFYTLDTIAIKILALLSVHLFFSIYRIIFMGLITCLTGFSFFFTIAVIILLKRQPEKEKDKIELNNLTDHLTSAP